MDPIDRRSPKSADVQARDLAKASVHPDPASLDEADIRQGMRLCADDTTTDQHGAESESSDQSVPGQVTLSAIGTLHRPS
jgi:hypothetical protein